MHPENVTRISGAKVISVVGALALGPGDLFVLTWRTFPVGALRCYQCGLYTDGVGSITPCINYTAEKHLKECPSTESHCIKYVSEGSTVRDCAHECVEKESWGIKIYCCREEGCNGAGTLRDGSHTILLWLPLAAILFQLLRQHRL
ncbi:uncharacterized protein [Hetaerina americana]|uniref:uncharacterized protein n=1 Tax=Hetaerina americana TaxID=62018 RepID=UPI003A7F4D03